VLLKPASSRLALVRGAAVTSLAAITLLPTPAAAGVSADQCIDANAAGQSLRRDGKFAQARAKLTICTDPACPQIIRSDCAQRIDELDRAQPTLVFDAKDVDGNDVLSVRVGSDGHVLTEKMTGVALAIDPGEHVFTFEAPGRPTVTRTFLVKEGDKDRRERVVFAGAQMPPGVATAQVSMSAGPETGASGGGMGTQRVVGIVIGAAGLAGLAVSGVFGSLAWAAGNAQKNDCASSTSCQNRDTAVSDHQTATNDGAVSTVAFIAGGALLVTGAVIFLTGGSTSTDASSAWVVTPGVGPGGGGFVLRGRF
jgi:hypothetical protein